MKTSQQLLSFYKWYMGDRSVSSGEPTPCAGLCFNISLYVMGTRLTGDAEYELYNDLRREMETQFLKAGLNKRYPFNVNQQDYDDETYEGLCRDNEARMAWVNNRISEGEV